MSKPLSDTQGGTEPIVPQYITVQHEHRITLDYNVELLIRHVVDTLAHAIDMLASETPGEGE